MDLVRVASVILAGSVMLAATVHAQGSGTKPLPDGWDARPTAGETDTKPGDIEIQDLNGKPIRLLGLLEGKPSLLVFWATWCPVCQTQTPRFKEAYERYSSRGLNVIAVDIGIKDSLTTVKEYAAAQKLPYRNFFDANQSASRAYRVAATPGVLLLDRHTTVVWRSNVVDFSAIEALLAGKPIPKVERGETPSGSGSLR